MRKQRTNALLLAAALAVGATMASTTIAQSGSSNSGSGVAIGNQTTTQAQHEIDAMNTMNETIGPMVLDATERVKLMKKFITSQSLDGAWQSFSTSATGPNLHKLTFYQAYQTSLKQQDLAGAATPSTTDAELLQREVTATQTLVQKQWTRVNELRDQVAALTAFLSKHDQNDAYLAWAEKEKATEASAQTAARAADDQREADIKAKTAHQEALRQSWDRQKFANNPVQPDDDQQGEYTDTSDNYYDGSYYNGYADPYYDVRGYRYERYENGRRRAIEHHARHWNRSHGPGGPGSGHSAGHHGGRGRRR